MYHIVNVLKEISRSSVVLKIPFYVIDINKWRVESWFIKDNELVVTLSKKDTALATAPPTALK